MTTLQFVGTAFGFVGMLIIRNGLDQNRRSFVLIMIVVLIVTASLWPLMYLVSLGLYTLLQIFRLLVAWRCGTPYDIPRWAYRLS